MNSSYKELLTDKMGIEYAPYIEYYRENSGELTELNRREQELLRSMTNWLPAILRWSWRADSGATAGWNGNRTLTTGSTAEIEDALVREKEPGSGQQVPGTGPGAPPDSRA